MWEGDQVVGVDYLAALFGGEVVGGAADHGGEFDGVEGDYAAGYDLAGGVGEVDHVAGIEVTVDAGDAGGK